MTKFFTTALVALALGVATQAYAEDVKLFSFTTAKEAEGKEMTFSISAVDGGKVLVDWGTGSKEEYDVADYNADGWVFTALKGTLGNGAVEVYAPEGTKINYLDISWAKAYDELVKITSFEVFSLPDVTELSLSSNLLESLDITSCVSLATLNAYDNRLTKLAVSEANAALSSVNVLNNFNTTTGEYAETAGTNSLIGTDWSLLKALRSFNINGNKAAEGETLNLAGLSSLTTLNVNGCDLPSIDLKGLTSLKTFNAQWNKLETADLSEIVAGGASVFLAHNNLTEVKLPDTSKAQMTRCNIAFNNFTFATLPEPGMTKAAGNYVYQPQADVDPVVNGNVIDLSALAKVGDTPTVFSWTRGDEAVPETVYTVENGVFTMKATGDFICSMTNEVFPALTLTTKMITISEVSGVEAIDDVAAPVEFYNLQGVKVSGSEPGIYVRRQGNAVSKVIVR